MARRLARELTKEELHAVAGGIPFGGHGVGFIARSSTCWSSSGGRFGGGCDDGGGDDCVLCRALMKRLGLVFGCFDFIVTPAGEYVFLEINQMGQFLWIEEANPDFPLLQMFCDFITSGDPDFRYTAPRRQLSYWDVRDSAVALIEEAHQVHLEPEHFAHIVHE